MRDCIYSAVSPECAEMAEIHASFRENDGLDAVEESDPGENSGFVYFIRAGRTNSVKIGYAKNVEKRLATHQTSSPHKLELIGFLPGTIADESDWHDRFRDHRIRGEWFELAMDLRCAINALALERPDFTQYLRLSLLTRGAKQ